MGRYLFVYFYHRCNVCWTEEVKEEEQEECIVQPFNALNTSNNSDTFVGKMSVSYSHLMLSILPIIAIHL